MSKKININPEFFRLRGRSALHKKKKIKPIINSTIINIKIHTYKLRFYIPQNISFATTILSTEHVQSV